MLAPSGGGDVFAMKVRCFLVLLLSLLFVYSGASYAAPRRESQKVVPNRTYTLKQAVERALAANPTIESKIRMLESARMNVGVAQSYFWPRLSLVSSYNRMRNYEEVQTYSSDNLSSDNWTKGLRAQMSLFAGFAHLNNLQKTRLAVQVEEARHKQARLELISNVQLQFLNLLLLRQQLKTAQDSVARLETQLKSAESYVAVDMAPYINVLQTQTDLAKAHQEVIRCKNELRGTQVQLNKYLNLPAEASVQYVGKLQDYAMNVGFTEEKAVREAVRHRPDLIIAQKSVEMAYKDMHINMGQFLPRVDATYDSISQSKSFKDKNYEGYTRNYWSAGISFTWDFFAGGQTIFQSISDKKRAESLKKDFEEAMNSAQAEVISALLDISAAKELITASKFALTSARESYDMANTRYATQTGTITELLDAQLRLTQAEVDASKALSDYHSARARFFYYIGKENVNLQ